MLTVFVSRAQAEDSSVNWEASAGGSLSYLGGVTPGLEVSLFSMPTHLRDDASFGFTELWWSAGVLFPEVEYGRVYGEVGCWFVGILGVGAFADLGSEEDRRGVHALVGVPLPFPAIPGFQYFTPYWRPALNLAGESDWQHEFGVGLKIVFTGTHNWN